MSRAILKHLLLPTLAASLCVAVAAGPAHAKCQNGDPEQCEGVIATIDHSGSWTAGGPEAVGVWVLENESPYAATRVELVFARVADGTIVRILAQPGEPAGRWQANVDLPAGGTWTAAVEVRGPDGYATSLALDAFMVETGTTAAVQPAGRSAPSPAPALAVVAAAGVLMGVAAMAAVRGRRRQAVA